MADFPETDNAALLEAVDRAGLWFRARRIQPIWARRLSQPERIFTLEGEEWAEAGCFVCRGEHGELWPQSAERLERIYRAGPETEPGGWQQYVPRTDAPGVWAARMDDACCVHSSWGRLVGKKGDYLLKDAENPGAGESLWIVDATLFESTYQRLDGEGLL